MFMTSLKISGLFPDTKVVLTDYLLVRAGPPGSSAYLQPGLAWPPRSDLLLVMSDIVDGLLAILASNLE